MAGHARSAGPSKMWTDSSQLPLPTAAWPVRFADASVRALAGGPDCGSQVRTAVPPGQGGACADLVSSRHQVPQLVHGVSWPPNAERTEQSLSRCIVPIQLGWAGWEHVVERRSADVADLTGIRSLQGRAMESGTVTRQEALEEKAPDWWPYAPEFPDWHVWRGVAGLLYARRPRSSPPKVVRGKTTVDLRDQIRLMELPR
jgi:hypothetical protein